MTWNPDLYTRPGVSPARKRPLNTSQILEEENAAQLAPVIDAIYGQETGHGTGTATSIDGAQGPMQVMPATFRRFAREGESLDNPEHGFRAGVRYVRALADRFGNDPAKIAAGYFSGEGNVATEGPTAWKADRADGNGKRVSSYVADVLKRMGVDDALAPEKTEAKPYPKWAEVASDPRFVTLSSEDQEATRRQYFVDNILPQLDAADVDATWAAFDADTRPPTLTERAGQALEEAAGRVGDTAKKVLGDAAAPFEAEGGAFERAAALARGTTLPGLLSGVLTGEKPPGSVMEGFDAGDPETTGATEAPVRQDYFNRTRERLLNQPREALERLVARGGVAGRVARVVLEERGEYEARAAGEVGVTATDDLRMNVETRPSGFAQVQEAKRRYLDENRAAVLDHLHRQGLEGADAEGELEAMREAGYVPPELERFRSDAGYGDILSHGPGRAVSVTKRGAAGAWKMLGDALGAERLSRGAAALAQEADEELRLSMDDVVGRIPKDGFKRLLHDSLPSILQQTPMVLAGGFVMAGAKNAAALANTVQAAVLTPMGVQTMGDAYLEGEHYGLQGQDLYRFAIGKAVAEVLPERLSLGQLMKMIGAGKRPTRQLVMQILAQQGVEHTTEQITTLADFLLDKAYTQPDLTLADWQRQAIETFKGTALQAPLLAGAGLLGGAAGLRFSGARHGTGSGSGVGPGGPGVVPAGGAGAAVGAPADAGGGAAGAAGPAVAATGGQPAAPVADADLGNDALNVEDILPPLSNPVAEAEAELYSAPEPADPAEELSDEQHRERLERGAFAGLSVTTVDPGTLRDVPDESAGAGGGEIGRGTAELLTQLADLGGHRLVFFRSADGRDLGADGLIFDKDRRHIYLNVARGDAAHLVLFGHELGHQIRRNDQALWEQFKTLVSGSASDDQLLRYGLTRTDVREELANLGIDLDGAQDVSATELLDRAYGKGNREGLREELDADVFGNRFAEPGFLRDALRQIGETDPGLLAKTVSILNGLVARLRKLLVRRRFGHAETVARQLRDINEIRQAAASMLAKYLQRRQNVSNTYSSAATGRKIASGRRVERKGPYRARVSAQSAADYLGGGWAVVGDEGAFYLEKRDEGRASVQGPAELEREPAPGRVPGDPGEPGRSDAGRGDAVPGPAGRGRGHGGGGAVPVGGRGQPAGVPDGRRDGGSGPDPLRADTAGPGGVSEPAGRGVRADAAPVAYAAGKADKAVSVVGTHYSRQPRTSLSGAAHGTGLQGAERQRDGGAGPKIRSRIYFYVDTGHGVVPEAGVGRFAHEARLDNLYDRDQDPLRLFTTIKGDDAREAAVVEAGFDGYFYRAFRGGQHPVGAAVLLGPNHTAVPVTRVGEGSLPPRHRAPALTPLDEDVRAEQLDTDRRLPAGQMSAARWRDLLAKYQPGLLAELERIGVFESDVGRLAYRSDLSASLRAGRPVFSKRRSDVGHKRTKAGAYVGAPEGMTPQKLAVLRKRLRNLVLEGEPGRFWYEESGVAILAEKLAGLLAIYSPQAAVSPNTTMALKALYQWMAGAPIQVRMAAQDAKAQAWMDGTMGEEAALQIKSGNFFRNLMRKIDEARYGFEKQGATIDLWMARLFGYNNKTIGSERRYTFAETEVKRLAKELGWEPQQAQAALWVAIKSRIEAVFDRAREEGIAAGRLKKVVRAGKRGGNASWVPVDGAAREVQEARILALALAPPADTAEIARASYNFGTALKERLGQISWEAKPGESSGVLPGIFAAPLAQQAEYLQAIDTALRDENGVDLIAKRLGLPVVGTVFGPSAWKLDVGAGAQTQVAIATERNAQNKVVVAEAARELLNAYAAIRGLVLAQEAVVWHYPLYDRAQAQQNGVEVRFGRDLGYEEMRVLYHTIAEVAGHDEWAPAVVPGGVRVLNFTDTPNKAFQAQIKQALERLPAGFAGWDAWPFATDGDYIWNDWKEHPNGEGYLAWASRTGRSDLQGWVASELAPRVEVVNRHFAQKYGWGAATPGEVVRDEAGPEGEVVRSARRAPTPGLTAAEAEVEAHFWRRLDQDREALVAAYLTRFERTVDTDQAREMSPDYPDDPTRWSRAVHEPASELARLVYARLLADAAPGSTVAFTGGGGGSGKGFVAQSLPQLQQADILYDLTMAEYGSTRAKVEQALAAGHRVRLVFVYRSPALALRGVFERGRLTGRVVPLVGLARAHAQALETFRRLVAGYAGDDRVTFEAYWNEGPTPRRIDADLLVSKPYEALIEEFIHGFETADRAVPFPDAARDTHLAGLASHRRGDTGLHERAPADGAGVRDAVGHGVAPTQPAVAHRATGAGEGVVRSARRSPLGFYSALARAVAAVPERLATQPAAQWKLWLAANAGRQGVKADEIAWSGIQEWLDLQGKQRVTRDEVLTYLGQGGVQVEETVLASNSPYPYQGNEWQQAIDRAEAAGDFAEAERINRAWEGIDEETGSAAGQPKYRQYTLPGGENYREVLLTLPFDDPPAPRPASAPSIVDLGHDENGRARFDVITGDGAVLETFQNWADARDFAYNHAQAENIRRNLRWDRSRPATFKSGHWEQRNVLAHIRLTDRTGADEQRVLFVEEIQSDWGQEGKKRGFDNPPMKGEVRPQEGVAGAWAVYWEDGTFSGGYPTRADAEVRLRDAARAKAGGVPRAPFVGKTEAWVALAIKRVIALAAQEGYDQVAFVNGEQSAERYDLSKQIERVVWLDNSTGGVGAPRMDGPPSTGTLEAYDHDGMSVLNQSYIEAARVEDYVGKEIAERLFAAAPRASRRAGIGVRERALQGLDLRVGGEGMKTFYDRIVPQVLRDVLKKLGGRVTQVAIQQQEGRPGVQTGFDITPEMRDTVREEGLPLFSARRADTDHIRRATDASPAVPGRRQQAASDAAFRAWHDAALADLGTGARLPDTRLPVTIMPAVLQMLGAPKQMVTVTPAILDKIRNWKHAEDVADMAPEEMARLLRDPAAVIRTDGGELELVFDAWGAEGPLFAVVKPGVETAGVKHAPLMTLFGRPLLGDSEGSIHRRLITALRSGRLAYVNLSKLEGVYHKEKPRQAVASGAWGRLNDSTSRQATGSLPNQAPTPSSSAGLVPAPQRSLSESSAYYKTALRMAREAVAVRRVKEWTDLVGYIGDRYHGDAADTPIFSARRQYVETVDRVVGRLDAAIDGLGNLPDQFAYLEDRYRTLGKIARVDEVVGEIREAFTKAAAGDRQAVYDYLTTRGANADQIAPPKLRAFTKRIKRTIGYVGDQLVARGLLDPASREEYRDRYLPRLYLKHMLSDQDWKVFGAGKKPTDMGYLKARKDIPADVRDLILGEIKDPAFLSANAIGRAMRDVALLDWLGRISQKDAWVLPESLVDFRGARVTPQYLLQEADRIERQAEHYTDANKVRAKQIIAAMRDAAKQGLAAVGKADASLSQYKQVPDTQRYGVLRGMWVRREIYDDIMGYGQVMSGDPTIIDHILLPNGAGARLTQLWKFSKVALNPPGQVRNFLSNLVMLQLSGVALHKVPARVVQAIHEVVTDGPYWKAAKTYGVTESTFTAQELYRIKKDLLALEAAAHRYNPITAMKLIGAFIYEKASDAYQFSEAVAKTAKIIDEMKKGRSAAEAAIEAQKWLFDYSLVNRNIRAARSSAIGMPFITYQAKVLPRLAEVAAKHPWRFLPWVALLYGMAQFAAATFGTDEDDLEKLKKSLPQWLQDRGHTVVLPFKDSDGRVQVADVGYFFPWTFYSTALKHLGQGEPGKAAADVGSLVSAPIIGAVAALAANHDTFTRRPIYEPSDPVQYQAAAVANYAYDLVMPPFLSSHGVLSPMGLVDPQYGGKLTHAMTGTTNQFGDPKATTSQALWALLGVNYYGLDPATSRAQMIRKKAGEIRDLERTLKRKLQDKALREDPARVAKLVADYRARSRELGQALQEYVTESEVPAAFAK